MKQKINTATLTKNDVEDILDRKLSNYPTKADLTKVLNNYPTKQDLDERFFMFSKAFRAENDFSHQQLKDEILQHFSAFANKILTAIDPMIKYIDERREEKEIEAHQLRKTRQQLDNHEKRIKKLEQS